MTIGASPVIGGTAEHGLRAGTHARLRRTCEPVDVTTGRLRPALAQRPSVLAVAGVVAVAVGLVTIGIVAAITADPVETDAIDLGAAPYDPAVFPDRHIAEALASAMGDDDATQRILDRLTPEATRGIDPRSFEDVQAEVAGSRIDVDGVLLRDDAQLAVLVSSVDGPFSVVVAFPPDRPEAIEGLLFTAALSSDDGPISDVEWVLLAAAMLALVAAGLAGTSGRWHWLAGLTAGLGLLERTGWEPAQDVAILAVPMAVALAVGAAAGPRRPHWLVPLALVGAVTSVLPVMSIDPGSARPFGHLVTVETFVGHSRVLQQVAAAVVLAAAAATAAWFGRRLAVTDRRAERWDLAAGVVAALPIIGVSVAGLVHPVPIDLTTSGWATAALVAIAAGRGARLAQRHADLTSIAATVADLGAGRSTDLADVIARALDDPTVVVLHADGDGFVDREGRPATLPDDPARSTLLQLDGETVGAIVHDVAVAADPERLRAACDAVKLSLANERLTAQIRRQLDEVRASRQRLLHAEERARRRIERDLHDGAQQRLTAAMLALRMVQADTASNAPDVAERLDPIGGELQRAVDEIRELARGVRPAALDGGLTAAVDDLAERAAVPVTVDSGLERRLPDDVETVAYFVVSEALTNATRHAGASHVTVAVHDDGSSVRVVVRDDGCGVAFTVAAGERPASHGTAGTGLVGLFDRLDAVGGTLDVRRVHDAGDAHGTIVEAVLPCAS